MEAKDILRSTTTALGFVAVIEIAQKALITNLKALPEEAANEILAGVVQPQIEFLRKIERLKLKNK